MNITSTTSTPTTASTAPQLSPPKQSSSANTSQTMADNEIDLYADDLGEEFTQENDYNESGLDLYDDVITPSANNKRGADDEDYGLPQDNGNSHHMNNNDAGGDGIGIGGSGGPPSKKIGLYVGNLSWWTTDQDVTDAVLDLGIQDIFEVKFFENRANGQSKGFCVITLGSDSSVRTVIEKLPKNEIHGQNPMVTPCNRQNLNHFEMQSRKTAPGGPGGGPQHLGGQQNFPNQRGGGGGGPPPPMGGNRPPLIQRPIRPNGPLIPGQPRMGGMPNHPMPFGGGPGGQWGPGMGPNPPPRPPAPMHPGAPPGMGGMPLMRLPPQAPRGPLPNQPLLRGPSTQNDPRSQMPHSGPPMPDWADPQGPHPHGPPGPHNMLLPPPGQSQPNQSMPPRVQQNDFSGPVPGMPPPGPHSGPAPHVNPAFFQAQHHASMAPQQQQTDQFGNRMPPGAVQFGHGDYRSGPVANMDVPITLQISEGEFDDIMNKNRTVSSSAIARAVTDASSGDFAAAIETLVTAISLIKQSKVANDERCKILISSLQDTLHGIETKSYSNSSSRKERPRSRERSRERTSRREKSRRERSRSRERDYRDRSRDRYHDTDRHYDGERYREKEREREREHRSSRH